MVALRQLNNVSQNQRWFAMEGLGLFIERGPYPSPLRYMR